jgi:hypothetical protein
MNEVPTFVDGPQISEVERINQVPTFVDGPDFEDGEGADGEGADGEGADGEGEGADGDDNETLETSENSGVRSFGG